MSEENWWPTKEEYDPNITKEKWIELLKDEKIFNFNSMCMMKRFLDIGGEATCADLAKEYGKTASFYIGVERGLASRLIKEKNLLSISDGKREWKFPVLFLGRYVDKTKDNNLGDYIWKLRPELKEALKDIKLLENEKYPLREKQGKNEWKYLIDEYKKFLHAHKDIAFDGEKYKWELITRCKGKTIPEIIELSRNDNVIDQKWTKQGLNSILKNKSVEFSEQVTKLLHNRENFNEAFLEFKKNVKILDDGQSVPNDERTASVYLTCYKPEDYTFYKYDYYSNLCDYLGIEKEGSGKCYEHYMSLIDDFCNEIQKDKAFVSEMNTLTKDYKQSIKLVAQNIIYIAFGNEKSKKFIKKEEGNLEMSKAEELANLLEHTHNLILHGAPGTGKTHLAKDIASFMHYQKKYEDLTDTEKKDLKDYIGFVQFHPSYDYTDFVEGLRPVNDNNGEKIGFERKDGVFKKFCGRALEESKIDGSDNFSEIWDKLINELNENNFVNVPLLSGRDTMRVELNEYGDGLANRTYENDDYVKGNWIRGQSKFFTKEQCYNIYKGLPGIPSGGHDNYRKAIVKYMKDKMGLVEYKEGTVTANVKPFIFIIDEINRGEMSKIFGELFFSIDPGYRGKDGLIQTQYQNLVAEGDTFSEGFYVPENVYIIGTMNDIDRNVESMDFAFRRRFTFKEITAEDTQEQILSGLDDSIREEAINRMDSLNRAIWDDEKKTGIEGLSSAYHIGGAYFLKLKDFDGTPDERFAQLWNYHLEGLLREYLRGMENINDELDKLKKAYENGNFTGGEPISHSETQEN